MGGIPTNFCSIHKVDADVCYDQHNPDAHMKVGWPAWSAQKNDTIGGWCVTTYPYPKSEHEVSYRSEAPTWENRYHLKAGYIVAECLSELDAIFIADLLNRECYVPQAALNNPNRWRWVEVGYLEGSLRSL